MTFLYNIAVFLYRLGIGAAAFFNPKAAAWIAGRKNLCAKVRRFRQENPARLIWLHCASLGEFEQGRPVAEGLKSQHPAALIVITFYSPSGYEIRKNYAGADAVFYLPLDTRRRVRAFISALQPDAVIFVKYEFWYHHLQELRERNIPVLLISAVFRRRQIFFRWYGGLHRRMLHCFTHLFVQDKLSLQNLQSLNIQSITVAGDTRIDRALTHVTRAAPIPVAEKFAAGEQVLVCGSTWPPEETMLTEIMQREELRHWKFIIAPHEIGEGHLAEIEQKLPVSPVRFSQAEESDLGAARVLLIDNIGMLSSLYRYGAAAFIGGGFGAGIHNTLEPAAWAVPVIFGPKYEKFPEAVAMSERGGGFAITNAEELAALLIRFADAEERQKSGRRAKEYLTENAGGSAVILQYLRKILRD